MSCQAQEHGLLPPLSGWLLASMVPLLNVLLNDLWLSASWSSAAVFSESQHWMPEKGGKRGGERAEWPLPSQLSLVSFAMNSLTVVGCSLQLCSLLLLHWFARTLGNIWQGVGNVVIYIAVSPALRQHLSTTGWVQAVADVTNHKM